MPDHAIDLATTTDVVIVGSGFGGLAAAKRLGRSGLSVTLITANAQYLFQPLLYQVATGILDSATVAPKAADLLARHQNITVVEGTVVDVDAEASTVTYVGADGEHTLAFSSLIAATGASQSYFGRDDYADRTFALKSLEDATALRAQILDRLELARTTTDPEVRAAASSFVIVGAGATGVEVAGQIAEVARRHFKQEVSITLVDGLPKVLPAFGGSLSDYAARTLRKHGVEVVLNSLVTDISDGVVTVAVDKGAQTRSFRADTIVWSAGVRAADFAEILAKATGCETDRAGRLLINPDLTVGGVATIYAIGDMTSLKGYPGQSPVAMQQGRHAADIVARKKLPGTEFKYFDKGSMAIINTGSAVVNVRDLIKMNGLPAFGAWLAVHVYYLAGFSNQLTAIARWLGSFIGRDRRGFDEAQAPKVEATR
ncbi:NAD(P)/FAD-dependent oxidoreductase [Williamsia sp. CHRR-6]|uniref:NAD(P)/FAD-dependent oxidoreductase n=1 Tax=Williamsia sp. CHRR-6 TaxID=2835871 RepID=UPI001BDA2515|nr:NAD(P)/FAD-dependent oxidoreductase [Williamsia sp. CHRR-6]MBT0567109.1 NAD(P)/FAD-dependent oxidoreductase [Williamsia sp. CHRR-6]